MLCSAMMVDQDHTIGLGWRCYQSPKLTSSTRTGRYLLLALPFLLITNISGSSLRIFQHARLVSPGWAHDLSCRERPERESKVTAGRHQTIIRSAPEPTKFGRLEGSPQPIIKLKGSPRYFISFDSIRFYFGSSQFVPFFYFLLSLLPSQLLLKQHSRLTHAWHFESFA